MSCGICCDTFTKQLRKRIECPYCDHNSCVKCIKTYLLNQISDPCCMSCKVAWTPEFLDEILSYNYRNGELRRHREEVLLSLQKSLLPSTQPYVELEIFKKEIYKKINILQAERLKFFKEKEEILKELEEEYIHIKNKKDIWNLNYRILKKQLRFFIREDTRIIDYYRIIRKYEDEKLEEFHSLVQEYIELDMRVEELDDEIEEYYIEIQYKKPETKIKIFIRGCPNDNCRGYLSEDWECGICKIQVCEKCNEIKESEHKCNKDNIKTAELLKKDTKPCPNCASMIYKIDGCNEMFCTKCHTAFNWITGAISTRNIHNPHYFEWLRQQNDGEIRRVEGDECDIINYQRIMLHLRKYNYDIDLSYSVRIRNHIQQVEIHNYQGRDIEQAYRNMRVSYLMKKITEEQWKYQLYKYEIDNKKRNDIREIFEMFVNVMNDILRKLINTKSKEEIDLCIEEMKNMREYFNKTMKTVLKRYKLSKIIKINDNWNVSNRE